MGRAPCCDKVGLKKGRWTAQEDKILMKYIETHGEGSWRSLPKNAGLLRCGKSCRLRWINYLRADLKRGNFTAEEEDTIIKFHSSLGNRWALIAGRLPGRTDNEIKNYWNSHLSKRIDSFRRPSNEALPLILVDTTKLRNGSKRKGRTARAAMKKNRINTISAKASNAAAVASAVKGAGNSVTDHGSNSGMLIASNPYQQQNMGMYNPSYESVGGGQELDTAAVNVSTSGDPMSEIKVLETDDILITFDEMIDEIDQEKEGWTESFAWAWDKEITPVATTTMREDTESGVANSNGESEDFNSSSSINMSFNLDYPDWDWSTAIVSSAVGLDDIDIHSSNFTAISAVDVSSGMWADEGEEILSWLMEDVDGHERSGPGFTSMECEQQQEALAAWLLS